MENLSYVVIYVLSIIILLSVSAYVYKLRKKVDEMHGMMIGMTFGMVAGLVTATLYLIPTGNFLYGVIFGSTVGLLFGIPFGKLGGHLGIMEGVVAGPMGGMMGAMLGQMIRPFDINVFVPFFVFIFLLTTIGLSYTCYCGANYSGESKTNKPSGKFIVSWIIIAFVLLSISIVLPFSISAGATSSSDIQTNNVKLPPYLQELAKEERKEAVIRGSYQESYQEIDLKITASKYYPNVIVAKKDIPLRINVQAEKNAGCAREIIFPDFNIDEVVPEGGSKIIEINPTKQGTFVFRCSMDMVHGKLIISD